jgi:hypothetical protein
MSRPASGAFYDVETARMAAGIAGRLLAHYDTGNFLMATDELQQHARELRTQIVTLAVETAEEVIVLCQQRFAPTRQTVRDALACCFGDTENDRQVWQQVARAFDEAWS